MAEGTALSLTGLGLLALGLAVTVADTPIVESGNGV